MANTDLEYTPKTRASRAGALLFLLVLGAPQRSLAGPAAPRVRFSYERAASATDCPDGNAVMNGVRARLGFNPFREPYDIAIQASVARTGDVLLATIKLDDGGQNAAERHLSSTRFDCREIASAMELAVSIAIDPLSGARPPPAAPPTPSIVVVNIPAASPPPAPPAPSVHRSKTFIAIAGLTGGVGALLGPTLGLFAGAGIGIDRWSLALEGRFDLSTTREIMGGQISTSLLAGTLLPCVRVGPAGGCALASLVALRAAGRNLDDQRNVTITHVALGGRLFFEAPTGRLVAFHAHFDLLSPLSRSTLEVSGEPAWTTPTVSATLGLAAVVRLK